METQAGDNHRAAVAVIARVVDVLQVHRGKQAAPEMRGVVGLDSVYSAPLRSCCAKMKAAGRMRIGPPLEDETIELKNELQRKLQLPGRTGVPRWEAGAGDRCKTGGRQARQHAAGLAVVRVVEKIEGIRAELDVYPLG